MTPMHSTELAATFDLFDRSRGDREPTKDALKHHGHSNYLSIIVNAVLVLPSQSFPCCPFFLAPSFKVGAHFS